MSVVVADFFHWTHVGDYQFDPEEFPDPASIVKELDSYGIKLMVSIWPTVSPISINYDEMKERGYLVGTERGIPFLTEWWDKGLPRRLPVTFYDSTNPEARGFVWSKVSANYKELGIKIWWLDACEPEIRPNDPANMRFFAGLGSEVMNIFPQLHARGFYERMKSFFSADRRGPVPRGTEPRSGRETSTPLLILWRGRCGRACRSLLPASPGG